MGFEYEDAKPQGAEAVPTGGKFAYEERRASAPSRPLPVNAGLANFGASLLGLPMDTVQNVLNLGKAGFGTAATALGRPDLAPELTQGIPGGSDFVRQQLRNTGLPGLSPDNPATSGAGNVAYEMTSRGGFLPGGVLPAAGSIIGEKVGGTPGAIIGQMAPSAVTAAYNAVRAPGLAQQQAQNQVRDASLKPAQEAGYVLPPSAVNPTMLGNAAESFAGKAALTQEAQLKNQQVTNRLVREELNVPTKGINVPPNAPLTDTYLNTLRDQASQPYRELATVAPQSNMVLQKLRDARSEAKDNWMSWDRNARPEDKRAAVAADQRAQTLETLLDRMATRAGRPDLVPEMRESRQYIAKTYDVERALNMGNGNVDANIIGRALDRGRPLSGNLETIAKFAEGLGGRFTRESGKTPTPGVSALNWPVAAGLGVEGAHYFGPAGAALATAPFVRGGVRQGLLTDTLQGILARPDYAPNVMPQGTLQSILQQAAIESQRR